MRVVPVRMAQTWLVRFGFLALGLFVSNGCGDDATPANDTTSGAETTPGNDVADNDTAVGDTTPSDTVGPNPTDTTTPDDTTEEPIEVPPNTFQVRVMNMNPVDHNFSGTDPEGNAFSYAAPAMTVSEWANIPVGTAAIVVDIVTEEGFNTINSTAALAGARYTVGIGRINRTATMVIMREPERTQGRRTVMFGTTGRGFQQQDLVTQEVISLPGGDGRRAQAATFPNTQTYATWFDGQWRNMFHFTLARVPENGLAYIVNSGNDPDGLGVYYHAPSGPGPVTPLRSNLELMTYSADPSTGALTFTAEGPGGSTPLASVASADNGDVLERTWVSGDTTSIRATDGTATYTVDVDFTSLDPSKSGVGGIAIVHKRAGTTRLGFLAGEPQARTTSDAYILWKNLSSSNVKLRCYWGFSQHAEPDAEGPLMLMSPAIVIEDRVTHLCSLSVAAVPNEPGGTPTHEWRTTNVQMGGYHRAFVIDGEANPVVYWARTNEFNNVGPQTWLTRLPTAPVAAAAQQ